MEKPDVTTCDFLSNGFSVEKRQKEKRKRKKGTTSGNIPP
jgi:hypothetical protein